MIPARPPWHPSSIAEPPYGADVGAAPAVAEVEYHVFEDEGHGFTKHANQLRAYRLIADFLGRHLGVPS